MNTMSLQEAQSHLRELISKLKPGEEVMITDDDHVVARLIAPPRETPARRQPGSAKGELEILSEDDDHLEDFREYMP